MDTFFSGNVFNWCGIFFGELIGGVHLEIFFPVNCFDWWGPLGDISFGEVFLLVGIDHWGIDIFSVNCFDWWS